MVFTILSTPPENVDERPEACEFNLEEQRNVDLVLDMLNEVIEEEKLGKIDEYFTEDFVMFKNRERIPLIEYKELLKTAKKVRFKQPYSDLIGKGDRVVTRLTEVTDQNQENESISIYQVQEGKIRRLWSVTH